MAGLLADGHRAALLIGSDLPTLPYAYVAEAARALAESAADVVLGPAEDGGYYLIGLAQPASALFEGIAWGTDGVLEATRARARGLGLREHLLPPWYDVDTAADLDRLRRDLAPPGPGCAAHAALARGLRSRARLAASARQQGKGPAHRLAQRARRRGFRRLPGALLRVRRQGLQPRLGAAPHLRRAQPRHFRGQRSRSTATLRAGRRFANPLEPRVRSRRLAAARAPSMRSSRLVSRPIRA